MRWWLVQGLLLAAALGATRASGQEGVPSGDAAAWSPEDAYRAERSAPLTVEVDFRAIVTAPHHTETLRVWVPIPPSDSAQTVASLGFETFPQPVEPSIAAEPTYGNRFAYFEFRDPRGAQIITHRFRATTADLRWAVRPGGVRAPAAWPESFAPYLRSDAAVVVDARLRGVLGEIAGPPGGDPATAARPAGGNDPQATGGELVRAMAWLNERMTYDHSNASLEGSSEHALDQRRGHCSDYHGLCSAFGRALGFPTRITYGLALFPKDSPSHCKMEAYLPPHGWVSFDISETQKLQKRIAADPTVSARDRERLTAAAERRLHAGFREAGWLLVTRGSDYDLAPPAARRVNVVRTIYAEADGEALPEPDPADVTKREFAWMTAHRFDADRPVEKPFADWRLLETAE